MNDAKRRLGADEEVSSPLGTRARNRTVVVGADKAGSLRSQVNPLPQMTSGKRQGNVMDEETEDREVNASGLDLSSDQDYVAVNKSVSDDFMDLGELFTSHNDTASVFEPKVQANGDAVGDTVGDIVGDVDDDAAVEQEVSAVDPLGLDGLDLAQDGLGDSLLDLPAIEQVSIIEQKALVEDEPLAEQVVEPQHDSLEMLDDEIIQAPPIIQSLPRGMPKIVRQGEGAVVSAMAATTQSSITIPDRAERDLVVPARTESAPFEPAYTEPENTASFSAAAMATERFSEAPRQPESIPEQHDDCDRIYWKSKSRLVGFLVTYDHDEMGSYLELRQGRLIISNDRQDSSSCLVITRGDVSPMHAIMRVGKDGSVQLLDQLSEAGTRVRHIKDGKDEFLSGDKCSVFHDDVIFFGERSFHVLLMATQQGDE